MKLIIPLILAFNLIISYPKYIISPIYKNNKIKTFFSANDNCREKVIEHINKANKSIIFAMYYFSDKKILEALSLAKKRGVKIEGIVDKDSLKGKMFINELEKKLGVKIVKKSYGIMHHKFTVIDNEIILTGSYNWTFSANNRNNENLVIIKDKKVALNYIEEYKRILSKNYLELNSNKN